MRLVGLMLCRNEDWVLPLTLRVALEWCDDVVILDHDSTDESQAVIAEVAEETARGPRNRVHVLFSTATGWPEMKHRQMTLAHGRRIGGTHFAIIDADEFLTANLLPDIRSRVAELNPRQAMALPMIPAWRDPARMRVDDCVWTRAKITLAWRDHRSIHWTKSSSGYEHHSRLPKNARKVWHPRVEGGVVHLQFSDWNRLRWKHRWYKMHEAVRYGRWKKTEEIDRMYSMALDETGCETAPIPPEYWARYQPRVTAIGTGKDPWQRLACEQMWREHGAETFAGLNLWGWPG